MNVWKIEVDQPGPGGMIGLTLHVGYIEADTSRHEIMLPKGTGIKDIADAFRDIAEIAEEEEFGGSA